MIGYPKNLNSKSDWINFVNYAMTNSQYKKRAISKLENLRDDIYINTLKESSKEVEAEKQTSDDYEKTLNPSCEKTKLNISDDEINSWIKELEK